MKRPTKIPNGTKQQVPIKVHLIIKKRDGITENGRAKG